MTNIEAARAVRTAIESGHVLHATANNGEAVTVGPYRPAVGHSTFAGFRYGRSRWAGECIDMSMFVARWAVDHVGRRIGTIAMDAMESRPCS